MKSAYTCALTSAQIEELKQKRVLHSVDILNKEVNNGFPYSMDIVLDNENKVRAKWFESGHFHGVTIVDDNELVLTQSQAKKIRNLIEAKGEYVVFDNFKQYGEEDLKRKDVQEWLHKFELLKAKKLEGETSQSLTAKYNEWRASQGYCRATTLCMNADKDIIEPRKLHTSTYEVEVYLISPKVEF